MPEIVRAMHAKSGLTEEVRRSTVTLAEAEQRVMEYVTSHVKDPRTAPLCGNSIATDRGFIARDMPLLDAHLHYRLIDVSSIKELCRRWYPRVYFGQPQKGLAHRALADIQESIRELNTTAHPLRPVARSDVETARPSPRALTAEGGNPGDNPVDGIAGGGVMISRHPPGGDRPGRDGMVVSLSWQSTGCGPGFVGFNSHQVTRHDESPSTRRGLRRHGPAGGRRPVQGVGVTSGRRWAPRRLVRQGASFTYSSSSCFQSVQPLPFCSLRSVPLTVIGSPIRVLAKSTPRWLIDTFTQPCDTLTRPCCPPTTVRRG